MKPKSPASSLGLLAGAISALIATAASGASPSETWNVGTGNWDTSTSNWSSGIWTNDSDAVFGGLSLWESAVNTATNETITISEANISANRVTFNYTGINVARTSTNTLTLTGTGRVTVSEVAQGPAVSWGGANSYFNAISAPIAGSVGLTKLGGGVLNLTGANTYSGTTTVSDGVLRLGNATALPGGINATGGTSALTLNGGTVELANGNFLRNLGSGSDQFQITGGTSGFSAQGGVRTVNIGGAAAGVQWGTASFAPTTLVLNAFTADSNLIVSNPIDLNGTTRTIASNSVGTSAFATLAGVISGSGAGLTKTGLGVLELSNANTYGGTTTVNGGTLRLSNATSLPGGIAATGGTSALTLNGGVVELANGNFLRNVGTGIDQFQITSGISGFSARGATREVTVNNTATQELVWGSATFNPSTLLLNDVTADNQLNLNNKIDLNGANRTIAVNSTSSFANITGVIRDSAASGAGLIKVGPGNLQISTAVAYSGTTNIKGGTLTLGGSNILPDTGALRIVTNDGQNSSIGSTTFGGVNMGNANGANLGAGFAKLDIGANSDTVGTVTVDGYGLLSGTTGTLTSTGSFELKSGVVTAKLAGAVNLNKTSGGLLILQPSNGATANSNTYTGTTTISGGVLRINMPNAIPGGIGATGGTSALTINGGVLELGRDNSDAITGNNLPAFARNLGIGVDQFQIPGGRSGFGVWDTPQSVNIGGNVIPNTVQWGSTYFNPSILVLGESTSGAGGTRPGSALTLQNGLDLNGDNRTIEVNSAQVTSRRTIITGAIINTAGSAAGLTKTGVGILELSGINTNTYTGVTTVSGGVLNIQKADALGAVGAGNGTIVNAGAALQIQGGITTLAEPLTLNGKGIVNQGFEMLTNTTGVPTGEYTFSTTPSTTPLNNTGALRNISGNNTYAGVVTLASDSSIASDTAANTLTLSAGVTSSTNKNLFVSGLGNTSIAGVTTGSGAVTLLGERAAVTSGTLTLAGASTYTGKTTVRLGTLNLTGSLNGSGTGTDLDFTGAGTFKVTDTSQTMQALTFSYGDGTVRSTRTAGTIAQTIASYTAPAAGRTATFLTDGGAVGTENKIVLSSGASTGFMGTRVFAGTTTGNSYAWYDAGGFVRAYTSSDTAAVTAAGGANTILNGTTTNVFVTGTITGQASAEVNALNLAANAVTLSSSSAILKTNGILATGGSINSGILQPTASGGEIVARVDSNTTTVSSVIADNGSASSLTKTGSGTLTITTAPTYTGTTTVAGGKLVLGALTNGTLPGSSVVVDSGWLNPTVDYAIGNNVAAGGTAYNSMVIRNGGRLEAGAVNNANFTIGYGVNSTYNSLTVTGINSRVSFTGSASQGRFTLGLYGNHNSVSVEDGAYFAIGGGGTGAGSKQRIGDNMGADYNSLTVTGAGSVFSGIANGYIIGNMGSHNSVSVQQGGLMSLNAAFVGGENVGVYGGSYNTVTIDGAGSLLESGTNTNGGMTIGRGADASNNGVTVSNGGMLYLKGSDNSHTTAAPRPFEIGSSTGSNNNYITVTGAGSRLMADYSYSMNTNQGTPGTGGDLPMGGLLGYADAATGNHIDALDGGLIAINTRLDIGGTNSAVNIGDGVGAKSYGTFQEVVMNTASVRVNINNGEFKFTKDTGAVTGLGQVELKGPAHISTAYCNSIDTPIFGSGSLTKEDSGTLSLTKANTYTGNTVINAGTLKLDGSGSIASSAKIVVGDTLGSAAVLDVSTMTGGFTAGSGQTLQGSGNIIGNVNVAGTLSPGNSIESLAITGNLTLANGATFEYEVNSTTVTADLQVVKGTGNVTLDSASGHKVYLTLGNLGNPLTAFATGTTFSLINYTGVVSGDFFFGAGAGAVELTGAEPFIAGLNKWTINYIATEGGINFSGDQVGGHFINITAGALTAVPEPGSLLALGLLVGSGAFLRSRRKVVG